VNLVWINEYVNKERMNECDVMAQKKIEYWKLRPKTTG
jgi:hypothetical protein